MVSMHTLSTLQDYRPEVAILGVAAVFLQMAEHIGIPAQEAFTATKNMLNGDDGRNTDFLALEDYMRGEWS